MPRPYPPSSVYTTKTINIRNDITIGKTAVLMWGTKKLPHKVSIVHYISNTLSLVMFLCDVASNTKTEKPMEKTFYRSQLA